MKKLAFLLIILAFTSCESELAQTKDRTLIYDSFFYELFKIRVDSVDYLVARSSNGISIIKHGEIKK
jgi:hypothetical protein